MAHRAELAAIVPYAYPAVHPAPPCALLRSINHVVSQSDVLLFLHKHVGECGPLGDLTLQQLGLAAKPVVCVPAEMSTIKAFASMVVSETFDPT